MPAASDPHAARLAFRSASVLPNTRACGLRGSCRRRRTDRPLFRQFTAWLAGACRVGGLPCNPERRAQCSSRKPGRVGATRRAYHRSAPFARARSEIHDMICPFLTFLDVQQAMAELAGTDPALLTTKRGRARVVAGISPVMRAGPSWPPNGLGVIPGACRGAGRGGARPGHHQRPPRPYRQHPHHQLVPARPGPLRAGCST